MKAVGSGMQAAAPIRRLALLGGESSGKTTLARALAEALGTAWVPEYGRQRWEELRETLSVAELLQVALTQVAWEDEHAARASGWLVCDTTPLTTLQYCLHDHGEAPPELWALAHRRYDLTVLCLPDFGFVQDGCRRDDGFRAEQHAWTLRQLAAQGVQPLMVGGSLAQRVEAVRAALQAAASSVVSSAAPSAGLSLQAPAGPPASQASDAAAGEAAAGGPPAGAAPAAVLQSRPGLPAEPLAQEP